ncbi:hypothetical protein, partial [Actinomyces sp. MRS3W]|uniref:hypothetical protein n=1 Tax=Actinomyces sp. MRS3W TaxID=2800796 RepID=UPI0028FD98D8
MKAVTLIAWSCRLRRPGSVVTPSVRSLALVLVCLLVLSATRDAVTVAGGPALASAVVGAGLLAAAMNAAVVMRDLDAARRGALRYYGFTAVDFLILYAVASLPLTVLEAACGMLVLDLPGWSDGGTFGLLLTAWMPMTALVAIGADRLRSAGAAAAWSGRGAGMGFGGLRLGGPRRRLPALCFVYLRSASWWPVACVCGFGALIVYAMGRFGLSPVVGVYVAGAYTATTVVCVLAEADDTPSSRCARSYHSIADAELRRAKLVLVLPVLAV